MEPICACTTVVFPPELLVQVSECTPFSWEVDKVTMLAVNFARDRAKLRLKLLVLLHIFSARHSNLDKHHFRPKLRVILQE